VASLARLSPAGDAAFRKLELGYRRAGGPRRQGQAGGETRRVHDLLRNNRDYIFDYGDRFRHGKPNTSSFVESAIHEVVAKRFVKKQQLRWTDNNAHQLLQVRTVVLNNELRRHFENWYPGIAANNACAAKAA